MTRTISSALGALGICLAILTSGPAGAQVNTETLAAGVTEPGWAGRTEAELGYAAGNVDVLDWRTGLSLSYATGHADPPGDMFWFRDRGLLSGSAGRKNVNDARVDDNGFLHGRYTRMFVPRWGAEVFLQAQYDKFRLLEFRGLAGGGGRVVPVHQSRVSLWLGTGYMAEYENREFDDGIGQQERVLNHRWNNYITLRLGLVPGHVTLLSTLYLQPKFDEPGDVQILEDARIEIAFAPFIKLTTSAVVRHDSRPPNGVAKTDVRVRHGLVITLDAESLGRSDPSEAQDSASLAKATPSGVGGWL